MFPPPPSPTPLRPPPFLINPQPKIPSYLKLFCVRIQSPFLFLSFSAHIFLLSPFSSYSSFSSSFSSSFPFSFLFYFHFSPFSLLSPLYSSLSVSISLFPFLFFLPSPIAAAHPLFLLERPDSNFFLFLKTPTAFPAARVPTIFLRVSLLCLAWSLEPLLIPGSAHSCGTPWEPMPSTLSQRLARCLTHAPAVSSRNTHAQHKSKLRKCEEVAE